MAGQPRSLDGRVVAITGAARGINLATARACAGAGCRVAIGISMEEVAGSLDHLGRVTTDRLGEAMGPPQSCTTTVAPRRSRSSTRARRLAVCRS